MIYSDWAVANTGIFYQLNEVKSLPFINADVTVDILDQEFLLENANKEMYSVETSVLVNSILSAYYHQWQDLTTFYKSIEPGTTSEVVSTHNNNEQSKNQVALNDTGDMFATAGNNTDATAQTSTKTKDYSGYKKFMLNNDFYDIIRNQIRKYIFINVY